MTWVYRQAEKHEFGGLWTVGYYGPDGWEPESDHDSTAAAAARVNYLNGGGTDPEALAALVDLVARCDGEEGVRADGSNIDTRRAAMVLERLGL